MNNNFFRQTQYTGLSTKFETFRQNIELTSAQKEKIISSHTHLRTNILQKLPYVKETFLTGSYKRNTMIRPPHDVDVFVVLHYSDYSVRPNSILNRIKRDLNKTYPNSSIRQDKPCVVLDFQHCMFELTPAIENYYNYQIPDTTGNYWMTVENPKNHETALANANRRLDGKLTPLIKMMKYCRNFRKIKGFKSFDMERIVINRLTYISNYRDGVQKLLRIYEWFDYNEVFRIERMTEHDFTQYCRNVLFGSVFPG